MCELADHMLRSCTTLRVSQMTCAQLRDLDRILLWAFQSTEALMSIYALHTTTGTRVTKGRSDMCSTCSPTLESGVVRAAHAVRTLQCPSTPIAGQRCFRQRRTGAYATHTSDLLRARPT